MRQVTFRYRGDTYQRVDYLRRKMRRKRRTKVSFQTALAEAIVAGLDALGIPMFPAENDEELSEDELPINVHRK